MGRSVTGISSLTVDFAISPVHWDWTNAPDGIKENMMQIVEDNLARKDHVASTTFELILSLFSTLCYYYENLDRKNTKQMV